MNPPKFPLSRIIQEGTIGDCPKCHSTTKKKYEILFFSFGDIIGCIQPECDNYFLNKNRIRKDKLKHLLK